MIVSTLDAHHACFYVLLYSRHWRDHTCWKLMVKLRNGHNTCWCVWLLEFMAMMLTRLLRYSMCRERLNWAFWYVNPSVL